MTKEDLSVSRKEVACLLNHHSKQNLSPPQLTPPTLSEGLFACGSFPGYAYHAGASQVHDKGTSIHWPILSGDSSNIQKTAWTVCRR